MTLHSHTHELSLGVSFFLGAVHALEPGHGKTAMFVCLMDGKRSFWHPVVMGLSTAIAHSVSLFAIAFGVHIAHHLVAGDHHHEQRVSDVLQWISAVLVVVVGGYLLMQALRGRSATCCEHHDAADGCHRSREAAHDCGAGSDGPQLVQLGGFSAVASCSAEMNRVFLPIHPLSGTGAAVPDSTPARSRYRTTAMLGLAVGLLPCPTALAAYFTGLSSGSPGTTYLIIGLFAAGIASSLSLVGILLQYFGEKLGHRSERFQRLPWNFIRSFLILGIGLIYLVRLMTDSAA